MLLIDLAAVSDQQLRRLLEAASGRGESELATRVMAELRKRGLPAPRISSPGDRTMARRAAGTQALPEAAFRSARPGLVIGLSAAVFLSIAGLAAWLAATVRLPAHPAAAEAPAPRADNAVAAEAASAVRAPTDLADTVPLRPYSVRTSGPVVIKATNCRELATPTDWIVCHDPSLTAQDRLLWRSYYRVRAAALDRSAVRRSQIAWWKARNRLSSPADLADHYARRIRQLKAVKIAAPRRAVRAASR